MQRIGEHAVVVGASVAGLLAARALADAYERVTVIERDRLPGFGEGRRAVPQGRHAHVLLASGQRAIEGLLPGFSDEMLAAGAVSCLSLAEIRFVIGGHPMPQETPGADVLLASRPLVEGQVRRRVLALANVVARDRCEVRRLAVTPDGRRVTGVRVEDRGPGEGEGDVHADVVVCASGRAAGVPAWLEALGYERPAEEELPVHLMYVSQHLRLREGALGGDRLVLIGARPGLPRGLALIEQEGGRWIATASGYGAEHRPPTDHAGFADFLATVAEPDVVAAVREAEQVDDVATHAFPANRRRLYEKLRRRPEGLLVAGDAVASFNPLYGQGMSVAALEAVELLRCLEEGPDRLAERFQRAAGKVVSHAWDLAVGGDLALPEIEGRRPLAVRLGNAYVERLLRVAEDDLVVAQAFNDVGDMIVGPEHIMSPRVLWRVARGSLRRRPAPAAAAPEAARA